MKEKAKTRSKTSTSENTVQDDIHQKPSRVKKAAVRPQGVNSSPSNMSASDSLEIQITAPDLSSRSQASATSSKDILQLLQLREQKQMQQVSRDHVKGTLAALNKGPQQNGGGDTSSSRDRKQRNLPTWAKKQIEQHRHQQATSAERAAVQQVEKQQHERIRSYGTGPALTPLSRAPRPATTLNKARLIAAANAAQAEAAISLLEKSRRRRAEQNAKSLMHQSATPTR